MDYNNCHVFRGLGNKLQIYEIYTISVLEIRAVENICFKIWLDSQRLIQIDQTKDWAKKKKNCSFGVLSSWINNLWHPRNTSLSQIRPAISYISSFFTTFLIQALHHLQDSVFVGEFLLQRTTDSKNFQFTNTFFNLREPICLVYHEKPKSLESEVAYFFVSVW